MECVILAGGLGTRMRPATARLPKSLLPIGKRPFIDYQLQGLIAQGVDRIVLCIGHQGSLIRDYVKHHEAWKIPIEFVDEKEARLGTGGALRLALQEGKLDRVFMVLYGDSYLPIDFSSVWEAFKNRRESALLTVYKNEGRWDACNACFSGGKVTLYDKQISPKPPDMRYIDYGLSVWRASVIEQEIPKQTPYDLADLLTLLSRRGDLAGFEVKTRFYEIGSVQGLTDFTHYAQENLSSH